jgi:hypothetical protein
MQVLDSTGKVLAQGFYTVTAETGGGGGTAETTPIRLVTPTPVPLIATTPAAPPAGWSYVAWSDPALEVALPVGWQAQPLPLPTNNVDQVPSLTPELRRAQEAGNQLIQSGAIRSVAHGYPPSPLVPAEPSNVVATAGFLVFVQDGDASLGSFADRITQSLKTNYSATILARTDVVLPSGTAISVDWELNVSGEQVPVRDYLFRLPDGRSMAIEFDWQGSWGSESLNEFSTEVINTLRSAS